MWVEQLEKFAAVFAALVVEIVLVEQVGVAKLAAEEFAVVPCSA